MNVNLLGSVAQQSLSGMEKAGLRQLSHSLPARSDTPVLGRKNVYGCPNGF